MSKAASNGVDLAIDPLIAREPLYLDDGILPKLVSVGPSVLPGIWELKEMSAPGIFESTQDAHNFGPTAVHTGEGYDDAISVDRAVAHDNCRT